MSNGMAEQLRKLLEKPAGSLTPEERHEIERLRERLSGGPQQQQEQQRPGPGSGGFGRMIKRIRGSDDMPE